MDSILAGRYLTIETLEGKEVYLNLDHVVAVYRTGDGVVNCATRETKKTEDGEHLFPIEILTVPGVVYKTTATEAAINWLWKGSQG